MSTQESWVGSEPDPHRYDEPEPDDPPCDICGEHHAAPADAYAAKVHAMSGPELRDELVRLSVKHARLAAEMDRRG